MPDGTPGWFPVFTLLLGYALKAVPDWLRHRHTKKRERESREAALGGHFLERRIAFQRQSVIDLQEAMVQLMHTTSVINLQDTAAFRETGQWHNQPLSDELTENHRLASARATMLAVRVRDESVRNLVTAVQRHIDAVMVAESETESDEGADAALGEFEKLNRRVGEFLGELDEEAARAQRQQRN